MNSQLESIGYEHPMIGDMNTLIYQGQMLISNRNFPDN
jgi:hypothetical protein